MPNSPEYFMQQALHMAKMGLENGELPIGAVVVLNDQIIAAAHTQEQAQKRLLVHAELLALEAADRLSPFPGKRREAKLFTTLEPCPMCFGAAMSFFIGEIYYALESPSDGAVEMFQNWSRRAVDFPNYRMPQLHGGLLRAESQQLCRDYLAVHPREDSFRAWVKTLAEL